jgi:hypothetical protein
MLESHNSLFLRKYPKCCYVFGHVRNQRLQEPLKKESKRYLDLNQALSSPPFSYMIRDMVSLGLLEVG